MSAPGEVLRRGPAWRDWRFWLGLAVSVLCLWTVARGIPLREVWAAMGEVDLLLLFGLSLPVYALNLWVRALRWRHLTRPIAALSKASLYRAQAVGFMVNNLLPLRVGELVRGWQVAREGSVSVAAVMGTIVLERVIDTGTVLLLAAGVLFALGAGDEGGLIAQGARLMAPVALLPLGGLLVLRAAPEHTLGLVAWLLRPLPEAWAARVDGELRRFTEGLGALAPGSHLFWIALQSAFVWAAVSAAQVWIAVLAFGLDLGTPWETLVACWLVVVATAVAVALPSAPGFVGTYQLACQAVLVRYGVPPATSLAFGLVTWLAFWISLVGLGALAVRARPRSLAPEPGKDPTAERR